MLAIYRNAAIAQYEEDISRSLISKVLLGGMGGEKKQGWMGRFFYLWDSDDICDDSSTSARMAASKRYLYELIEDTTLWYIAELRIANRISREVELVHLHSVARVSSVPSPLIFETPIFVPINDR